MKCFISTNSLIKTILFNKQYFQKKNDCSRDAFQSNQARSFCVFFKNLSTKKPRRQNPKVDLQEAWIVNSDWFSSTGLVAAEDPSEPSLSSWIMLEFIFDWVTVISPDFFFMLTFSYSSCLIFNSFVLRISLNCRSSSCCW